MLIGMKRESKSWVSTSKTNLCQVVKDRKVQILHFSYPLLVIKSKLVSEHEKIISLCITNHSLIKGDVTFY